MKILTKRMDDRDYDMDFGLVTAVGELTIRHANETAARPHHPANFPGCNIAIEECGIEAAPEGTHPRDCLTRTLKLPL